MNSFASFLLGLILCTLRQCHLHRGSSVRNNQQCGRPLTSQEENKVITCRHDELEGCLSTVKAEYYEVLLGQSNDYALTWLFMPLMCRENSRPINSNILHMFNRNYTDSGTPQRDLYCMTVHMPNKISLWRSFWVPIGPHNWRSRHQPWP